MTSRSNNRIIYRKPWFEAAHAQVWREEGLFLALKDVARAHMTSLGRLCAQRTRVLLAEPASGPALEALALPDGGPLWHRVTSASAEATEGEAATALRTPLNTPLDTPLNAAAAPLNAAAAPLNTAAAPLNTAAAAVAASDLVIVDGDGGAGDAGDPRGGDGASKALDARRGHDTAPTGAAVGGPSPPQGRRLRDTGGEGQRPESAPKGGGRGAAASGALHRDGGECVGAMRVGEVEAEEADQGAQTRCVHAHQSSATLPLALPLARRFSGRCMHGQVGTVAQVLERIH